MSDLIPTPPLPLDDILAELSNITLSKDPVFAIPSVTFRNGGNYTCFVINEAGFETNSTLLYIRPIFILEPVNVLVTVGQNVTLNCEAESFPSPLYQWQQHVNGEFNQLNDSTNAAIQLTNIQYNEFGTYRCIVTASGTDITISTSIVITGKEILLQIKFIFNCSIS